MARQPSFAGAWPTAIVLAGLAIGVAALAVQSGMARLLIVAALLLLGAVAAPIADRFVTTPGEHAEALVRTLVAAAETANLGGMRGCFDRDGSIHYGSSESPGMDFAEIDRGLASLRGKHRIASNRITTLDARTESGVGVVDLSCSTETASMGAWVPCPPTGSSPCAACPMAPGRSIGWSGPASSATGPAPPCGSAAADPRLAPWTSTCAATP